MKLIVIKDGKEVIDTNVRNKKKLFEVDSSCIDGCKVTYAEFTIKELLITDMGDVIEHLDKVSKIILKVKSA